MKKLISTLTLAVVMMFGSTFTFAADTCRDGIIVFGNSGIIVFGVTIGTDPCAPTLGSGGIIISD